MLIYNYTNTNPTTIRRALLSVSDKTGLNELGQQLSAAGIEIISTGGTAKILRQQKIPVVDIQSYTGFPEIMNGRVKTMHPRVMGGILGLRDTHRVEAETHDLPWIDLVVVNLYPFSTTIQKPNVTTNEAVENIDIGGPTMIRSAAKNVGWVTVLVDTSDYEAFLKELESGNISYATRRRLAAKAFGHTAQYDTIIHGYLTEEKFSEVKTLTFNKYYELRYGENPHQSGCVYKEPNNTDNNILNAKIIQGKQLSYNNVNDADGALSTLKEFSEPACVVVKHANPCGVAVGSDITEVFRRAYEADSLSAFGGIIAINRPCTAAIAAAIAKVFAEIVLAPSYDSVALRILSQKKNLRVLELGPIPPQRPRLEYRAVDGGMLAQDLDTKNIATADLRVVTKKNPTRNEIQTMLFAWKVLKHMKSNAILLAQDNVTTGIGVGQVSRVDAVDIAIKKAGEQSAGSVLASDAFFPFRDSIDKIAGTGITAIIQPGGSIKDQEVVAAADEHELAMVFTGVRCFKH
ncbi:MAG: bifunctional phosphoribosylaminoimidazolecarboxamide formyltransferase/IMP cyclohydrolase [Candidatus Magasanikbacteria bacterium]|nr:bifunctional phosphoribosylaminoimidazolecarboxamide formyltransferase/IMP cyclohydrolase [Candidatus Magasanikbacteria bacterium]